MQYNLSISELAERINVSPALINEWEMGNQMPDSEQMRKLAIVFSNLKTNNNVNYKSSGLLNKLYHMQAALLIIITKFLSGIYLRIRLESIIIRVVLK
jgi:transcriptional regulator with XRE-family HTH domain